MKKRKKFIIIGVVAVVVLAATLGTVAFAQADDGGGQTLKDSLYTRIAQIYQDNTGNSIDATALQEAFTQAREELATETQENMWQKLVDEGKITQEQLDAYKAWLEAKPQMTTDEFKQWLESKPEGLPFGLGERGFSMKRGFGQMGHMFGGRCAPDVEE